MKVLIRAPNWIGDAVIATPALRELRRIFKDSRITLCTSSAAAGLYDDEGIADQVLELSTGGKSARGFLRDCRRLRKGKFELAILLQNAFGAALLARAAGAKRIAGYPTDGRRFLLHHSVAFEPQYRSLHQVRYYLNIAAQIEAELTGESSIRITDTHPQLRAGERVKEAARALLAEAGVSPSRRLLTVNPGATNSRAKRWLPDRFAQAADRLADLHGYETVIVGSAGDLGVAVEVRQLMRSRATVLAGRTSIGELKGLLSLSALMISNDTGGAHVAAALGIPTIVIFGPTEHVSTRPLSNVAEVVRHEVDCSPCMLRDCPIDHRCMTRVETIDVCKAAEQLLAKSGTDFSRSSTDFSL
jgi:heptosyltransferase-2